MAAPLAVPPVSLTFNRKKNVIWPKARNPIGGWYGGVRQPAPRGTVRVRAAGVGAAVPPQPPGDLPPARLPRWGLVRTPVLGPMVGSFPGWCGCWFRVVLRVWKLGEGANAGPDVVEVAMDCRHDFG